MLGVLQFSHAFLIPVGGDDCDVCSAAGEHCRFHFTHLNSGGVLLRLPPLFYLLDDYVFRAGGGVRQCLPIG